MIVGPERTEVVTNATKFARGYDPKTGRELWRLGKHSEITVPTPFLGKGLIWLASGYRPVQPIYAVRPGATGDISLKDKETKNNRSPGARRGRTVHADADRLRRLPLLLRQHRLADLLRGGDGRAGLAERLGGVGGYTASPVAADGRLYFTGEENGVRVVKAGPKYELLAINPLGEVCMATPAIADGLLFVRTEKHLIALGRDAK